MITSNSTYSEIAAQIAIDESNIDDMLSKWVTREHHRLAKTLQTKKYHTPTRPITYHSKETNIHWRILLVLMHKKRPSAMERARGLGFIVESENRIKYTIIKDMVTGQPILALTYPNQTFFVSAHAVRRYRERCYIDENNSFETICDTIVRHSPSYVYYPSMSVYGSTHYMTIAFRVADGLFLGYYDTDKEIAHLETFISEEMLTDQQKEDSAYYHNNAILKKQRDMVLGLLPFDDETSASMLRFFISVKDGDGMKQLTEAEVEELVALAKEKETLLSEEEKEQKIKDKQERNRERYKRKMKRKGYK